MKRLRYICRAVPPYIIRARLLALHAPLLVAAPHARAAGPTGLPTGMTFMLGALALLCIFLVGWNIHLRKRLEDQGRVARRADQRFRGLVSLSSDWYWEQDEELRFTTRSSWDLDQNKAPTNDFLGKRRWEMSNIVGDPGWAAHKRLLEQRLPFRNFEYQYEHEGQLYWVSVNGEPFYDGRGRFRGYRGTGRDITARKQTEAALRASEERFNEIISCMPVALFIKDEHGRITLMNKECERQWGVGFADVAGTDGSTLFTSEEMARFRDTDRQACEKGLQMDFEERCHNLSTNQIWPVREFKKPVFDEDGKLRYLIGMSVDITEQKKAEQRLRRSREALRQLAEHQSRLKEEERKRIARDIHDELGQNLLALRLDVSSLVQRAAPGTRLQERARTMIETVDRTIRSVRMIINDLRPGVLDLGLSAALEWQVEQFVRRTNLACTLENVTDEHELQVDEVYSTTLFRVLQESLTNVQRHAQATSVRVCLHREANELFLTVQDNGRGGAQGFEQRDNKAFGLLGMRERLTALGGGLRVESAPGSGTTLVARLPVAGLRSVA